MKPNILLIVADELRADALSVYGNQICTTPRLDQLAASGVRFGDCVVTQPTCTPSRASLLTGCFPSVLKTRMVGCRTPDDPRFLGHVLKKSGYRTMSIGKIHLVPQKEEPDRVELAMAQAGNDGYFGFSEVDLVNGHGDGCFGKDYEAYASTLGVDLGVNREKKEVGRQLSSRLGPYHFRLPVKLHSSNYIADRTIEMLKEARQSVTPFFAHVSFPDPHHPFTVPEPWGSAYNPETIPAPIPHGGHSMPSWYESVYQGEGSGSVDTLVDRITGTPPLDYSQIDDATWRSVRASYYGMTSCLDYHVGRILDQLDESGLAESTVVFFVSDHGDYLGDHGFVGKGMHFDSALRVPLLAKGPGIDAGQLIEPPASTLDIAPTLLDFAGISEPGGLQGISFAAALRGEVPYARTATLTENDDDMMPVRMRTLTTADWRLTSYAGGVDGELYDRHADPSETHNHYFDPAFKSIRSDLQEMLFEEVLCACDYANGRQQQPAPTAMHWIPRHNRSQ